MCFRNPDLYSSHRPGSIYYHSFIKKAHYFSGNLLTKSHSNAYNVFRKRSPGSEMRVISRRTSCRMRKTCQLCYGTGDITAVISHNLRCADVFSTCTRVKIMAVGLGIVVFNQVERQVWKMKRISNLICFVVLLGLSLSH